MKSVRSILILLFCCHLSYSQKVFDLTIWCDSTVNPKGLRLSYYNGYEDIFLPDTLSVRKAVLADKFVSKMVAVNIDYVHENESIGSYVFFVNEKKSSIHLSVSGEGSTQKLEYRNCLNAVSVLDTHSNTLYKKIFLYRFEEAKDLSDLWSKHGSDVVRNDSLFLINRVLQKRMNNRTLSFFKGYSSNYFCFLVL
ncbi:hypothetical protein [Paraflavitalea sp. CAU 1676]|uniref:hypothetical protein n=1 Tax=Paraflavitalea sp. CAU 1676 TaxID=3032598 RepID=UPI0023DBCF86|nr:hypothetical protein [Paraflavitalea sp. CAU 1676]MDF2189131.1 hypothetical protein [Paraflavitalea sp. CAU 1676]